MSWKKAVLSVLLVLLVLLAVWYSTIRPEAREIIVRWVAGR